MIKVILTIISFLTFASVLQGQELVYIPDSIFRVALGDYDLLTNDSLDLRKVDKKQFSIISFIDLGIQDLYGIQYFEDLHVLNVSKNNLVSLDYLPPKLAVLFCSSNRISDLGNKLPKSLIEIKMADNLLQEIKTLPPNIEKVDVSNNRIIEVNCSPPHSLQHFVISSNLIREISCEYSKVKFINLYDNPLDEDALCDTFVKGPYKSTMQNCRMLEQPYAYVSNQSNADSLASESVRILFVQNHAWPPILQEIDTFDFVLDELSDSFYLSRISFEKRMMKGGIVHGTRKDSLVRRSFSSAIIDSFIANVDREVLDFTFKLDDEVINLNLNDMPYSPIYSASSGCQDCSSYIVSISIKRGGRYFGMGDYYKGGVFNSLFSGKLVVYSNVLKWINSFFILNEVFDSDHPILKGIYSRDHLRKLREEIDQRTN